MRFNPRGSTKWEENVAAAPPRERPFFRLVEIWANNMERNKVFKEPKGTERHMAVLNAFPKEWAKREDSFQIAGYAYIELIESDWEHAEQLREVLGKTFVSDPERETFNLGEPGEPLPNDLGDTDEPLPEDETSVLNTLFSNVDEVIGAVREGIGDLFDTVRESLSNRHKEDKE